MDATRGCGGCADVRCDGPLGLQMGVSSENMPNLVFSAVYGTGFFIMLNVVGIYGYGIMPLFPFQRDEVDWAFIWLIQTIFD